MTKKITLSEFDSTKYLDSDEAVNAYLKSAFDSGDSEHIVNAISNVMRARGMTKTAKQAGLDRSNLYDSFPNGDPRISTVTKIMDTFGYQLSFRPKFI